METVQNRPPEREPGHCPRCDSPDLSEPGDDAMAMPGKRTVKIEVLGAEHRAAGVEIKPGAAVGIVLRAGGEIVAVPEQDVDWRSLWNNKAPDVLARLLRQGRMYADGLDGDAGAELLMPDADVLAALGGQPAGGYTAATEVQYRTVKPGWWVLLDVDVLAEGGQPTGQRETAFVLVTGTPACTMAGACGRAPRDCRVLELQGHAPRHVARHDPVMAQIPAASPVTDDRGRLYAEIAQRVELPMPNDVMFVEGAFPHAVLYFDSIAHVNAWAVALGAELREPDVSSNGRRRRVAYDSLQFAGQEVALLASDEVSQP